MSRSPPPCRSGPTRRSGTGPRPRAHAAEGRDLRQSGCARRQPHRGHRHHRRTRLRLPAIQAVRFPDRQRGRADIRRRPVADHADGAESAGRRMHQGGVLPDRSAHHLPSRNPEAGRSRRAHHRRPHLVACASRQQEDDRTAGQGRDREGFFRGEDGPWRSSLAVLPLSGARPYAGDAGLPQQPQHRDVLLRRRFLRLQVERRPTRSFRM